LAGKAAATADLAVDGREQMIINTVFNTGFNWILRVLARGEV
jgi:hypothetical protein